MNQPNVIILQPILAQSQLCLLLYCSEACAVSQQRTPTSSQLRATIFISQQLMTAISSRELAQKEACGLPGDGYIAMEHGSWVHHCPRR